MRGAAPRGSVRANTSGLRDAGSKRTLPTCSTPNLQTPENWLPLSLRTFPRCALAVWALVVRGDYKKVEKIFLVASAFYICYIVAGVIAQPVTIWNAP